MANECAGGKKIGHLSIFIGVGTMAQQPQVKQATIQRRRE